MFLILYQVISSPPYSPTKNGNICAAVSISFLKIMVKPVRKTYQGYYAANIEKRKDRPVKHVILFHLTAYTQGKHRRHGQIYSRTEIGLEGSMIMLAIKGLEL